MTDKINEGCPLVVQEKRMLGPPVHIRNEIRIVRHEPGERLEIRLSPTHDIGDAAQFQIRLHGAICGIKTRPGMTDKGKFEIVPIRRITKIHGLFELVHQRLGNAFIVHQRTAHAGTGGLRYRNKKHLGARQDQGIFYGRGRVEDVDVFQSDGLAHVVQDLPPKGRGEQHETAVQRLAVHGLVTGYGHIALGERVPKARNRHVRPVLLQPGEQAPARGAGAVDANRRALWNIRQPGVAGKIPHGFVAPGEVPVFL